MILENKIFPLLVNLQLGCGQLKTAACVKPEDLLLDIFGELRIVFWMERKWEGEKKKVKAILSLFFFFLHHSIMLYSIVCCCMLQW